MAVSWENRAITKLEYNNGTAQNSSIVAFVCNEEEYERVSGSP